MAKGGEPMSATVTAPTRSEHAEQVDVIAWAALMTPAYPELGLLFAIPNFSGRLGKVPPVAALRQAANLKREGRKKGVPDLMLPVARHGKHGLFIEMKRTKGGASSAEQRAWIAALTEQGYKAVVCKGAEAAITTLREYLT